MSSPAIPSEPKNEAAEPVTEVTEPKVAAEAEATPAATEAEVVTETTGTEAAPASTEANHVTTEATPANHVTTEAAPTATEAPPASTDATPATPFVSPQESRFKTDDGLNIFIKKWLVPEGTPLRAKIIFNHGFSEHMDAYNHFFPDFANRGYEIIGYDQRGAGHTSPLKKDFGNTNEYYVFHDLEEIIEHELKDYDGKVFLWGHSMGGAITLNYAVKGEKRDRFDGYIANSPLVEVHPKTQGNPILVSLAPFIAKIHPKYKSKVAINYDYLTDDKERADEYRKDPLRLGYTTADQAIGFLNRGKRLLSSVFVDKFIDKPVLVSHGTEDYVNNYDSSKKFFSLLKVSDKEFKTYEGWRHELTNLVKEKSDKHRDDLLEWFDKHTGGVSEGVVEESAKVEQSAKAEESAKVEESVKADEPVAEAVEPVEPKDAEPVAEAEAVEPAEAKAEEPAAAVEAVEPVADVKAVEPVAEVKAEEEVGEEAKEEAGDATEGSEEGGEESGSDVSTPKSAESSPNPAAVGAGGKKKKKNNKKKKGKK